MTRIFLLAMTLFIPYGFTQENVQTFDTAIAGDDRTSCTNPKHERWQSLHRCLLSFFHIWALNLYEIQNSWSGLDCGVYDRMDRCIQEKPACTLDEALLVSREITQQWTYDIGVGNYLHSFVALRYACKEGNAVFLEHNECLKMADEKSLLLDTVDIIFDKYSEFLKQELFPRQQFCDFMWSKIDERSKQAAIVCNCSAEVSDLICYTVTDLFNTLDPKNLGVNGCGKTCAEASKATCSTETAGVSQGTMLKSQVVLVLSFYFLFS